MYSKAYPVRMEIAGRMVMFREPTEPISFPAPPRPTADGIFAEIARWRTAHIRATVCRICAPVRFTDCTTNYFGPQRKGSMIKEGNPLQLPLRYLFAACFQLEGVVVEDAPPPTWNNHLHALQDVFNRRLVDGKAYGLVHLGTSDCAPDYVGPWRPETRPVDYDEVIYGFPLELWDAPDNGKFSPRFGRVEIKKGILLYD